MNEGTREAFQIDQRCKVGEYFATVRYIGPVPPSQGDYLIILNNLNKLFEWIPYHIKLYISVTAKLLFLQVTGWALNGMTVRGASTVEIMKE